MANTPEKRDVIITLHSGKAIHSIKEMEQASRQLRKEWQMASTDEGRKKIEKELQAVNTKLKEMRSATLAASTGMEQGGKRVTSTWEKVGKVMTALSASMIAMAGFQWVTQQFRNMIQRGAELSDSLTDVQKVTGFTAAQMEKMQRNLKHLDTRTARKELLELTYAAGKLGLQGVEDVTAFVRAGDKINVALGKDLGSDAILQIGKLVTVFQIDKKFGLEDAMIRVGSAINTLGMKSIAAEGFLVEFTRRLAGISGVADIPIEDNLALAATLDNLGQTAETSSTALSKMFIKMASDAESFATMAKVPLEEWRDLLQTDAVGALKLLLQEVGQTEGGINGLAESLGDLGMDGGRVVGVLGALAKNTELLTEQQRISKDAFKEGTSVLAEFDLKNRNMAANLEVLTKWLNAKLISSSFVRGIESLTASMREYITIPASDKLRDEQREMQQLADRVKLAGDNQRLRTKNIQELIDKYPTYFGHLNAERASLDDISTAIRKVNQDYKEKLKITLREEELQEIQKEGLKLMEQEEEALRMVQYRLEMRGKHGRRGWADWEEAVKDYQAAQQKVVDNEKEYMRVLEAVDKLRQNEEQRTAPIGPDDGSAFYDAIQAEIKAKKESTEATKELSNEEKKRIQAAIDATKSYAQQLEDVRINAIDNIEQREIAAAQLAYLRKVQDIEATEANEQVKSDLIAALAEETQRKVGIIEQEAASKRLEELKKQADASLQRLNDSDLLTLELKLSIAEEGSLDELEAHGKLLAKRMEVELQSAKLSKGQRELIEQEFIKNIEALWAAYDENRDAKTKEQRDQLIAETQQALNVMSSVFGQIFSIMAQGYQNQLAHAQIAHDKELQSLNQMYDKGIISRQEYDRRKQALDDEAAARERQIKRDQFEADQNARVIQSIMDTLGAVVEAAPNYVLMAAMGVLGAGMTAAIAAEPNPYYAGGPTGERHKVRTTEGQYYTATNAGTLSPGGMFSQPTYGIVAEKGPELVIPNDIYTAPQYSDMMAHLEHVISRGYAAGGTTTTAPLRPFEAGGTTSSVPIAPIQPGSATDAMLIDAINMNTRAVQQLMSSGVRAYMEWETLTDGIYTMEQIDNRPYFDGTNRRPGQRM